MGWQYCGNVGKLANSQVAVMSCLSNGDFASMTDARLYLPEDWCNDPKRCDKADIQQAFRMFKTKTEIAYEIVEHHNKIGVEFDFGRGDGLYGNDPELARKLMTSVISTCLIYIKTNMFSLKNQNWKCHHQNQARAENHHW